MKKIDKEYYEILKQVDYKKMERTLRESFERQVFYYDKELLIKMLIVAYILLRAQDFEIELKDKDFNSFINLLDTSDKVKETLQYYTNDDVIWMIAKNFLGVFQNDELSSFILFNNSFNPRRSYYCIDTLPEGVLKLGLELLEIKDNDNILEVNSGMGNFEIQSFLYNQKTKLKGLEIDTISNQIAILRFSLFSDNEDIFENINISNYKIAKEVNKIFVNFPFSEMLAQRESRFLSDAELPEWKINKLLLAKIKEGTKVVSIVRESSLSIRRNQSILKEFIEKGLIETVISLPTGIFQTLNIQVTLLVFSRGNKKIRFIDATDSYTVEKKNNTISNENIEEILELLSKDTKKTISKDIQEIIKNDYNLNVNKNIQENYQLKEGVELKAVIKNITRGSQLRLSELEELKSDEVTPYLYLTLTNINDGIIEFDNNEQYLRMIPEKLEKYCIKNNSFLIAKIGTPPYKFAIAQIDNGTKLLANGNLFIIELDELKINPWYLAAFFGSDQGIEYLKYRYKGNVIPHLSILDLETIVIPLPDLKEQNKIAQEYIETVEKIKKLKEELENEKTSLRSIFKIKGGGIKL